MNNVGYHGICGGGKYAPPMLHRLKITRKYDDNYELFTDILHDQVDEGVTVYVDWYSYSVVNGETILNLQTTWASVEIRKKYVFTFIDSHGKTKTSIGEIIGAEFSVEREFFDLFPNNPTAYNPMRKMTLILVLGEQL